MSEIVLKKNKNGCLICTSHKYNHDGYLRVRINGNRYTYHKYLWEKKYGKVPDRYDLHHTCLNPNCCNIKHLQLVESHKHIKWHIEHRKWHSIFDKGIVFIAKKYEFDVGNPKGRLFKIKNAQ